MDKAGGTLGILIEDHGMSLGSGGGAHLTKITPDIVQRIEDWMKNPYDAETWAKSEAKKAGTHVKKGKSNA